MRSSILTLGLACALGLSVPGAAEEPARQAKSPEGAAPSAAKPAEAPAAPAAAPAAPAAEPTPAAAAPAEAAAAQAPAAEAPKPEAPKTAAKAATPARHGVVLGPNVTDEQGRKGRIHTVASGDTLWEISDAYLGTPWVWPSLWKSNEDIQNPHRIYPGDKLFVSPNEMRRLSEEEAARMLAGSQAPAALGDGLESGRAAAGRSYRFAEIETAGIVSTEELRGAASIVDSHIERVWLGDHDMVIVGFGEGEVSVGDQLDIFRTTNVVNDPDTGLPVGHATVALGWLEVTEVHPETSTGIIRVSRGEIRRGDRLLPRVRPASEIAIGARPEVDGRVVYTWADRMEMGGNDLVYLNRGADSGLEVGSPLEVYRSIGTGVDEARNDTRQLPDRVVARMLVVVTTPETATAVVTHSASEIEVGDHFRGSDGIWY
jgi:LysM repeat protein